MRSRCPARLPYLGNQGSCRHRGAGAVEQGRAMGVTGLHIIAIHIGVEVNHIAVAFCPSCIGDGSVQGGIDIVPHACPKVGSLVGTDTAEHRMDTPHQGKLRGNGKTALQRI